MLDQEGLPALLEAVKKLDAGFSKLPAHESNAPGRARLAEVLGTTANLEALWVAGRLHPGKKILASEQAHYTHGRISGVLQLPFETVPCDAQGRMDANALAKRLKRGDVGTVVATMGTTATGSVDPLPEILALRAKYGFR